MQVYGVHGAAGHTSCSKPGCSTRWKSTLIDGQLGPKTSKTFHVSTDMCHAFDTQHLGSADYSAA